MALRWLTANILSSLILFTNAAYAADDNVATNRSSNLSAIELIAARCTFCHSPAIVLVFSQRMLEQKGSNALDGFLAKHHAPDAQARAAIVEFLSRPMTIPQEP